MLAWLRHLHADYLVGVREAADAEAQRTREELGGDVVARRLMWAILIAIGGLMIVRFAGNEREIRWAVKLCGGVGLGELGASLEHAMTRSPDARLWQRVWWAAWRIVGYGVLPIAAARLLLGMRLSELGASARGLGKHLWIYVMLIVLVAPVVITASYGAGFQAKYPYYKLAKGEPLWPAFVAWEALYAANFVALELFFRGFMVQALRPLVGYASIHLMMVPYAMIHFGKPLPEAIGSIFTGFLLGTLAMKHRSVWGGVLVHVSVACSMDFLSVWQRGLL